MNLFHTHKFDPTKWELHSETRIHDNWYGEWTEWIFLNTCLKCGRLVEKKVSQ
jgi:hypothetical protein